VSGFLTCGHSCSILHISQLETISSDTLIMSCSSQMPLLGSGFCLWLPLWTGGKFMNLRIHRRNLEHWETALW